MFSRVGFIKHSGSTDEIMDRLKATKINTMPWKDCNRSFMLR